MPTETRLLERPPAESSAPPEPSVPTCRHEVQFYERDAFLVEQVADFLRAGLAAGASAVVIATAAHRDGIAAALADGGLDVDAACADGRLVLLDADGTLAQLAVGGIRPWERFVGLIGDVVTRAGAAGTSGDVHAYGEMVDRLWQLGDADGALQLEDHWNRLTASHRFSLLCAYAIDNFRHSTDAEPMRRVCDAHTRVRPVETLSVDADRDSREREIVRLQQRARALEEELAARAALESSLREALAVQQRTEQALQEASRAKDEFIAMLGHELRNPLSPILTALELMRLRVGEAGASERAIIERQVGHLVRLVDDLLDVARFTRGDLELRLRPLDLAEVVARALEQASPLLEQRRHHVRTSVSPGGLGVVGDEHRLIQVVANLLTNAAKYTAPGGHIEVTARREHGHAIVTVRDTGIGIAPALLLRLFDPFAQGERTLDRAEGGLGLGLAIVESLVVAHGGAVRAHSEGVGRGSTFEIRLPIATGDAPLEVDRMQTRASSPGRAGRRVLIVDDNRDAGSVLAEVLEDCGYVTAVAIDGPSALASAEACAPDIALIDIGLPVMDGYELARRLRELPGMRDLKLVAVTGYGQDADRARTRDAGIDHHLVKPVDLDVLERVIGQLLDAELPATRAAPERDASATPSPTS